MDYLKHGLNFVRGTINNLFIGREPWQILAITTTSTVMVLWVWDLVYESEQGPIVAIKKKVFKLILMLPQFKEKINDEKQKLSKMFVKDFQKMMKNEKFFKKLPEKGLTYDKIISLADRHSKLGGYDWKGGKVSGTVYYYDENIKKLVTDVFGLTYHSNPLHCDVFPGTNKCEADIIAMVSDLFNGNGIGTITSGGTESILLACKSFRDYAYETKNIKRPEIVMPVTAHAAFDKAAQYFKLRVHAIPMCEQTGQANIKLMENKINKNTILLVGSAPNFPHGIIDDIEAISKLGIKYNIPVHVDACLGGFLIAFANKVGYKLPLFDFRLPGVTSISVDTHKYGFTPKGSSVILYTDTKFRNYQYTVTTDWPGGVYGSPTISGSRPGGSITTAWATLLYIGYEGYLNASKAILDTSRYIENELRKMDGIYIIGNPQLSVIAIGSKVFNIYKLKEALGLKGWNLNNLQFPSAFHLCITHVHTQPGVANQFVNDVKEELTKIMKNPGEKYDGKLAFYGTSQTIPDRNLVGDFIKLYLDSMYSTPKDDTIDTNGHTSTKL